ncbi:MAG: hypothetical protein ACREFA_08275 [Stellaceae bacterium]
MSTLSPPVEAGLGETEPATPAAAQAWLAAVPRALGALSPAELAAMLLRVERIYDRFPELLARFPRRTLLRQVRAVAKTLPEDTALPLLLLCAAAEPSDPTARASLFARAARSRGGASLPALLRLFRPYAAPGRAELGPALAALDPAVLSQTGTGVGSAEEPAGGRDPGRRHEVLALAARLRARLRPAPPPQGAAPPARRRGTIGFASFLAQWPELSIAIPAAQLQADHAGLGADGMLRAVRPAAGPFCSCPVLTLPAGRYRVRITGEAAAGAAYSVEALCRLGGRAAAPLREERYVRDHPIAGILAELVFSSDIALRDFHVVVRVADPPAALAIASLAITGDRLRPDPEA